MISPPGASARSRAASSAADNGACLEKAGLARNRDGEDAEECGSRTRTNISPWVTLCTMTSMFSSRTMEPAGVCSRRAASFMTEKEALAVARLAQSQTLQTNFEWKRVKRG